MVGESHLQEQDSPMHKKLPLLVVGLLGIPLSLSMDYSLINIRKHACRYVGDEGQLDLVYWHRNRQMRHFGVEIMGVISMNGEHQVDMSYLVRRYFNVHLLMLAVNFYDRCVLALTSNHFLPLKV